MQIALLCGLLAAMSVRAGLLTSVSADSFGPHGYQSDCSSSSFCSTQAGDHAATSAQAAASYGSVSAYVQGGANQAGYSGFALAAASFSDTLTFYGGIGTGTVTVNELIFIYGTGSLRLGASDPTPGLLQTKQTFTFGTPFTLTLSAIAVASFQGYDCDGGSLLIQKVVESLTFSARDAPLIAYSDRSGHVYNTAGTANFTATPEPGTWVLAVIGLALVIIAKHRFVRGRSPKDYE